MFVSTIFVACVLQDLDSHSLVSFSIHPYTISAIQPFNAQGKFYFQLKNIEINCSFIIERAQLSPMTVRLQGVKSRKHQDMLRQPSIKDEQSDESSSLTSKFSPARIAQRPQTLNVTPVYRCESHRDSGACRPMNETKDQTAMLKKSSSEKQPSLQSIRRQQSTYKPMNRRPYSQHERQSALKNSRQMPIMRSLSTSDITSDVESVEWRSGEMFKAMQSKYDKMGSAVEKERFNRFSQQGQTDLTYPVQREPDWRQLYKLHQLLDRQGRYHQPNTWRYDIETGANHIAREPWKRETEDDDWVYPNKSRLVKDVTVPNYTLVKNSENYRQLNVHRLSTGCLTSNGGSSFNTTTGEFTKCTNSVKWV